MNYPMWEQENLAFICSLGLKILFFLNDWLWNVSENIIIHKYCKFKIVFSKKNFTWHAKKIISPKFGTILVPITQ